MFSAYKIDIYNAYLQHDLSKWKRVIDQMEKKPDKTLTFRMELLNYQYGYISFLVRDKKHNEAEDYLDLGWKHIKVLEKSAVWKSKINAYKSSFYSSQITIDSWRAPILGPKILNYAEKAIEEDAKNPRSYFQYGQTLYYMPSTFGGSKTKGIENYLIAQKMMEKNSFALKSDWNYLNLLINIALAYEKSGNFKKAQTYYKKALAFAPQFKKVKENHLPRISRKLKT